MPKKPGVGSRHLEIRAEAAARLDIEVCARWASPSSRVPWGGDALLLSPRVVRVRVSFGHRDLLLWQADCGGKGYNVDAFVMAEIAKADADNDCRLNHAEFVTYFTSYRQLPAVVEEVPPSLYLSLRFSHLLPHCVSPTVSFTVSLTVTLPHRLPHCVSLTESPSLCLSHCVSPTVSLNVSLTASLSLCLSHRQQEAAPVCAAADHHSSQIIDFMAPRCDSRGQCSEEVRHARAQRQRAIC
jgi:hypothetical protein